MNSLERMAVRRAKMSQVPVLVTLSQLSDLIVVHRQGDKRYVLIGDTLRPLKVVIGERPT